MTGPGFVYRAALQMSKTDVELIDNIEMFSFFEDCIRGGYVGLTKRLVECNMIDQPNYDENKIDKAILNLDWNAMYAELLEKNFPTGNMRFLNEEELREFKISKVDADGDVGYFVRVDITVPEHLRRYLDDFPLIYIQSSSIDPGVYTTKSGGKGSQNKLVAGHFDMCKYTINILLAKKLIELGCTITKIYSVVKFEQKPIFKEYIDFL